MLVGRERERAAVAQVVEAARSGRGAALVLRGDPGIGKTVLLREAIAAAGDDLTVLRLRGLEAESELAYAGLAALCGPLMDLRDRLPTAQRLALGRALAVEDGPPQGRLAVGAAVLGLLGLAAEERPVLAVIDDVQWVDEPSREAIGFAARRLGDDGIGLLMAERITAGVPPAALGIDVLPLGPLGDEDARAILAAGPPLAVPVADRILATAGGNPLALVEIPPLLTEDERDGRVQVDHPLPPGTQLEGVLADRLRDLPDGTRRALVVAAAAEVRRGDVVLAALARENLTLEDLEPAEARHVVEFRGGEVRFRHPLLRAAAYHAGAPAERRRAHRHVAAVLPPGDPQVAWQLAAAAVGPDETVAAALERAALDARARNGLLPAAHAHSRAAHFSPDRIQRARRLLEAARDLLPAGERDRALRHLAEADAALTAVPGPEALALAREHRILRAQVELRAGAVPAAREVLEQEAHAIRLHDPLRAAALLLEACLGAMLVRELDAWRDDAVQALAVARGRSEVLEALALMHRGAAAAARDDLAEAREALEAAEGLPFDEGVLLAPEAAALAGHAWTWMEDHARAERLLEQLVAAARRAGAAGALPYPLATLAVARWRIGRWDEAVADAEEAETLGEQTGQATATVLALGVRGLILGARGEVNAADAAIDAALALGERTGNPAPRSYALLARAELLAARGENAVAAYEAVRDEALPGNQLWSAPLVEALVRAGAPDRARAALEAYEAVRGDRRLTPALIERCRGLLARAEAVDGHFRRALALHEHVRAPLEEARTRLAWGERLLVDGRREDAREPLRDAVAAFDRLGARLWGDVARRELRGAGALAVRPADSNGAEELTPHELRVCRLAAQGMTNREVAAALFVSSKTVEHHLRNAFRKLGIRRRTELARVMAASG